MVVKYYCLIIRSFTGDVGIRSTQVPIHCRNIEQGIRQATVTVYNTITDAAGIVQVTQAYVLDNGVGEWALYLYDGSAWVKISTKIVLIQMHKHLHRFVMPMTWIWKQQHSCNG